MHGGQVRVTLGSLSLSPGSRKAWAPRPQPSAIGQFVLAWVTAHRSPSSEHSAQGETPFLHSFIQNVVIEHLLCTRH